MSLVGLPGLGAGILKGFAVEKRLAGDSHDRDKCPTSRGQMLAVLGIRACLKKGGDCAKATK